MCYAPLITIQPASRTGLDLFKRVLRWIRKALGLVVCDILDAQVSEHIKEHSAHVCECHSAVMRIVLLDKHVAIEASHLGNGEYTDTSEGACRHVEHLALSDVRAQVAL